MGWVVGKQAHHGRGNCVCVKGKKRGVQLCAVVAMFELYGVNRSMCTLSWVMIFCGQAPQTVVEWWFFLVIVVF